MGSRLIMSCLHEIVTNSWIKGEKGRTHMNGVFHFDLSFILPEPFLVARCLISS